MNFDKLAKISNGVKYLLVRQDLFARTIDAKKMKTKDSEETVRAILTVITKKLDPRKVELTREQNLLESVKKYAKPKEYKFTLQGLKPRLRLLSVLYDHWNLYFTVTRKTMETSTFNSSTKLTNIVTTLNSWRNCSIDLIPKNVKNSYILFILYSKPPREFRKPKVRIGDRVRISKQELHFGKGCKPQFTPEVLEIVAIFSRNSPTYTIKDEQDEFMRGKFDQKMLIKVL